MNSSHYQVRPGKRLLLSEIPTHDDGGYDKQTAREEFRKLHKRLVDLEELLYADGRHAVLVVLQGMDTSGKDSTIRAVFGGVGPTGVRVASFKQPTTVERSHDFLWRVHAKTPARGNLTIFNRSHYEDVLIVRVENLVPEKQWKRRYDHINAFEKLLADEGAVIVKFFLHISKDYQKQRLQRRLNNPRKHWKFDAGDLPVRARWDDYMKAYEEALRRCSTPHAPWYVVPAERRWFRNLLITRVLVDTLESLDMKYPEPTFDPSKIKID
ncbi:MAG: polyphosphate kinase 2 family protein [Planctomycetota bacterium]|nr:MAG: polyphosphate kinase 2 family protein [Planctomycetota bacterium]